MRPTCYFVLAALLFALSVPARAQYQIKLAADSNAQGCAITPNQVGVISVYAFLWGNGASSVETVNFAAYQPPCLANSVWLGDNVPGFPATASVAGSTQTEIGLVITYADCQTLPYGPNGLMLAEISFYVPGNADPSCCPFLVTHATYHTNYDAPGAAIDCADNLYELDGSHVIVNPDASCPCQGPLPVEPTTWGKVKSLYR
jgi:hypothetical protein